MVVKVSQALQVFQASMVAQESKAFQGRLELRDWQACLVNPGIQDHVAVMESPDYQVFYFHFYLCRIYPVFIIECLSVRVQSRDFKVPIRGSKILESQNAS